MSLKSGGGRKLFRSSVSDAEWTRKALLKCGRQREGDLQWQKPCEELFFAYGILNSELKLHQLLVVKRGDIETGNPHYPNEHCSPISQLTLKHFLRDGCGLLTRVGVLRLGIPNIWAAGSNIPPHKLRFILNNRARTVDLTVNVLIFFWVVNNFFKGLCSSKLLNAKSGNHKMAEV